MKRDGKYFQSGSFQGASCLFGFMMIRSVMFLSYLEAAPALVGWWHVKEPRLDNQLITSMVQTWTQHMDKLRHGRRLREWILSWFLSTIHHLIQQERWFFVFVLKWSFGNASVNMSWTILLCTVSWPEEMAQGLECKFVLGTCSFTTLLQL